MERLIKTPSRHPRSTLWIARRYGVRPSTKHFSFLGKGWASNDNTATTPTYQPP